MYNNLFHDSKYFEKLSFYVETSEKIIFEILRNIYQEMPFLMSLVFGNLSEQFIVD